MNKVTKKRHGVLALSFFAITTLERENILNGVRQGISGKL